MSDENARSLAQYLNDHPDEAKKIRSSVSTMLAQYKVMDSALAGIGGQLRTLHEQAAAFVSSIRIPVPTELFAGVADALLGLLPANWPHPVPDFDRIKEVLEQDGIPIAHIPRAEIVQLIVDADSYEARIRIIEDRAADIAADCFQALQTKLDGILEKQVPLAVRAIEAYQSGFFESAQALAVSVCDTYLKKSFRGKKYKTMQAELAFDKSDDLAAAAAFNYHYALTPAVPFLVPWFPGDQVDPPTKLSRHVTIHNASTDHVTPLNATIAIMLMTSMTLGINYAAIRARRSREGS